MMGFVNAEHVSEHIGDCTTQFMFDGEKQEWLPLSTFNNVTTKQVIEFLISKDDCLFLNDKDKGEFIDKVYRSCRKLFATCVYAEFPLTCLKVFVDRGFTDANFPLSLEDCPGEKLKRKFKRDFIPAQKLFNAAFFGENSFQVLDHRFTKPIDYNPSDSSTRLGQGSYGGVYLVKIHPDHRGFKLVSNKDEFAMKVTSREGRDQKFNQAMATLPHPHLLKCLASYTFSTDYFMIYEKADCDVETFIQRHRDASLLSSLSVTDFAKQLCGLAGALSVIHYQRTSSNTLNVPEPDLTSYNLDIKPNNILMFVYNRHGKKTYWLRLSDHSLAKVNTYNRQNRESHRTQGNMGTLTYRAPESSICQGISRPYDIWSLGCVWLELLVWYNEGFAALDNFRDARISQTGSGAYSNDGFYRLISDKEAEMRPSVLEKIDQVRNYCEGPLKEIADVIPSMLEIDHKKRPNAQKLVALLGHLDSDEDAPPEVVSHDAYLDIPTLGSPPPASQDSDSEFEGFILTKPT